MEQERQEEGLKEKVEKALGANMSLKTQRFREAVIRTGKATGDSCPVHPLHNCLIELSRLKDDQSKGMVITALIQNFLYCYRK